MEHKPPSSDSPFVDPELMKRCASLDPINGQPKDRDFQNRMMYGFYQCRDGEGQAGPVVRGSTPLKPNSDSQVMVGYRNVGGGQDQYPVPRPVAPSELKAVEPVTPQVEARQLADHVQQQKETDLRRASYCRSQENEVRRLDKMGTKFSKGLASKKADDAKPYCSSVSEFFSNYVDEKK